MTQKSNIEWTETTWNPVTGCTKISEGCQNCYARTMTKRLKAMGQQKYVNGFEVTLHPGELNKPLKWKKPSTIFVCSMSDLFHKKVPLEFIHRVFDTMNSCPQHTFQVLTKRSERLSDISQYLNWTDNIWAGVTVENYEHLDRIDNLISTDAKVKFLSLEPLLGPIAESRDFYAAIDSEIDWVIVGGESGPGARPIQESWVRSIQEDCKMAEIPFFFKQWGGVNKKKNGSLLDGLSYKEYPKGSRQSILQEALK